MPPTEVILEDALPISHYGVRLRGEVRDAMREYSKQVAIDFFNWQKKDHAECCADMSAEEWYNKYISKTVKKN